MVCFDVFEEDLHQLLAQDVNREDVPIMLDQLRYFVENKKSLILGNNQRE